MCTPLTKNQIHHLNLIDTLSISYLHFNIDLSLLHQFTPRCGQVPKSLSGGVVIKKEKDRFEDSKHIYIWDGYHNGGEWEVFSKSNRKHIGILDPAKVNKKGNTADNYWHDKSEAIAGRVCSKLVVLNEYTGQKLKGAFITTPFYLNIEKYKGIQELIGQNFIKDFKRNLILSDKFSELIYRIETKDFSSATNGVISRYALFVGDEDFINYETERHLYYFAKNQF